MRSITDDEKKLFRDLTSGRFSNFVLLATKIDGIETAVIAAMDGREPHITTRPLAVLVNKDILQKLEHPGETLIAGHTIILE